MPKCDASEDAAASADAKTEIRRLVLDGQLDVNAATRLMLAIDKQLRGTPPMHAGSVTPDT